MASPFFYVRISYGSTSANASRAANAVSEKSEKHPSSRSSQSRPTSRRAPSRDLSPFQPAASAAAEEAPAPGSNDTHSRQLHSSKLTYYPEPPYRQYRDTAILCRPRSWPVPLTRTAHSTAPASPAPSRAAPSSPSAAQRSSGHPAASHRRAEIRSEYPHPPAPCRCPT